MSQNDLCGAQSCRFTGIADTSGAADILGRRVMNAMDELLNSANTLSASRKPKRPVNARAQHYELVSRYSAAVSEKKAAHALEAAVQAYASADAGKETQGLVKAKGRIAAMDKTIEALDSVSAIGRDFHEKRAAEREDAAAKLAAIADDVVAGKTVKQDQVDSARWAATSATASRAQVARHVPVESRLPKLDGAKRP
jgi:hypothetical protein